MDFHYRFYHTCGHFGVEPTKQNKSIEALQSNPHSRPRTLRISLAFDCPFCFNPALVVKGGEGVLVILTSPPSPFPNTWHIIRACAREDVELGEWSLAHVAGGHMAWIPEPCGTVDVFGGVEEISRGHVEDGPTTRVSCSWKKKKRRTISKSIRGSTVTDGRCSAIW